MTDPNRALDAAIVAAGLDPRNPAVRQSWQAGIEKYLVEAASQFMPDAKGKETDLEGAVRNMIANRSSHFKARNGRLVSIEDDSGEHSWIVSFDDMAEIESALTPSSEADKEKGR